MAEFIVATEKRGFEPSAAGREILFNP